MMLKKFKRIFLGILYLSFAAGLSYAITCGDGASEPYTRATLNDVEFYCVDRAGVITSSGSITTVGRIVTSSETVSAGGIKLGSSNQAPPSAPTAGASGTGSNFGLKIPYVNASGATISRGAIVVSSNTVTSILAPGTVTTAVATNTWVGIADADLASNATGYMIVAGWALALTTQTVSIGDFVISTGVAGYGIGITTATAHGAVVGKALSVGNTAGGLTLIRVGD